MKMISAHRYGQIVPALIFALAVSACRDSSSDDPIAVGQSSLIHYVAGAEDYRAVVYTPAGHDGSSPLPLVVMVHGCNTSAEQQQAANLFDAVADRERFILMYPDNNPLTHGASCWRFHNPLEIKRDQGDVDGIAGLTRIVMDRWLIDAERVYVVGMSAGAFITSGLGAAYPDLYAAIGVVAGGAYGIGLAGVAQPAGGLLVPPAVLAQQAYEEMGPYARVLPVLEMHGDMDTTIPPETGANAVQQWLMTNNLVVSGSTEGPFPLMPTETQTTPGEGEQLAFEIDFYRDAEGCLLVQHVRIEGMDHFWPGGSNDPESAAFTDPKAPNGAEMSWQFFKRFTKSDTALPCVESR